MYIKKANHYKPEKKLIIISGAGLSAESGISTFRDSNGLWENHKIEEVCEIKSWKQNFDLVHDFYNKRRIELKDKNYNEAHKTIARLKEKYKNNCIILTQNVDDLLEKSGIEKTNIVHLHGNIKEMRCLSCGSIWDFEYKSFNSNEDKCPKCNSKRGVKPNVIFFGEEAPMYKNLFRALEYLKNPESILIIVGTMGNVIEFRSLIGKKMYDETFKKTLKCTTILNNLEKSEYLPDNLFDLTYYEKATIALPKIEKWLETNYIIE